MQRLITKITINTISADGTFSSANTFTFKFVNSVECSSSFEELTKTAKIILPRNVHFANGFNNGRAFSATDLNNTGGGSVSTFFKRGSKINIQLGYLYAGSANQVQGKEANTLREVFTGFITRVDLKNESSFGPITLYCEDEMWLLKQHHVIFPLIQEYVTKNAKTGKTLKRPKAKVTVIGLRKLVSEYLLSGDPKLKDIKTAFDKTEANGKPNKDCVDMDVYIKYRFDSSVAKILEEIKSEYGVQSYFYDGKLHIGFESDATKGNVVEFKYEEVVIDDSDLTYQIGEEVQFRVRVESIDFTTNKRTIKFYPQGTDNIQFGEQRDYKMMNASEAEMDTFGNARLKGHNYTGYKGSVLCFGDAVFTSLNSNGFTQKSGGIVFPGDIFRYTSSWHPENSGDYQVKAVDRTFNTSGYRQKIELGARLEFINNEYKYIS